MNTRSAVQCSTIRPDGSQCRGTLGAWVNGAFMPAGHLVPSRDLWHSRNGILHVRCPFCRSEFVLLLMDGRLTIKAAA